jgi:arylsulfatase A-like enzyme
MTAHSETPNLNPQRKSLVLITVDCLRADHCGFYGYPRATTPFLDKLAAESFIVPSAVVAGAPTYYSLPAILASRAPLALGRDVIGLALGESTLATVLRDAGYATAAFSAANPYISARFGYEQGFEVFEDFLDFDAASSHKAVANTSATRNSAIQNSATQNSEGSSTSRSKLNQALKSTAQAVGLGSLYDELYFQYCLRVVSSKVESMDTLRRFPAADAMVDRALAWLTLQRQPFFLWLHLMDPHSPYYPSAPPYRDLTGREISATEARYLNEFWNRSDLKPARLKGKRNSVVELYDAGIRAMDAQMARLVSHLKQSGLWDKCAFVLTADHGEEFLDHGRCYHAPINLHEEITRVPLMIRAPDSSKKEISKAPFSHLHLAPTLLEILDVPAPESFQGTSLWRRLQQGDLPRGDLQLDDLQLDVPWEDPAITECVYGCTNPLRQQDRLGARLLSARTARHKLVIRIEPGAVEELYDLEGDPHEERPLAPGVQMEVRRRLLYTIRSHMQKISDQRNATMRLKARLRDLRIELQTSSR